MKLVIVRHGGTEWTLSGRYTGTTDLPLTPHGCRQAALLAPLVERVLAGDGALAFSSPLRRATETAALALPGWPITVDPLVAEYNYGDYEGLTDDQIRLLAPGWDIWRDGCPHGESTDDVGMRADAFLDAHLVRCAEPVVVVTHGHFSRILAARALGLAAANGHLFASLTASISVIEDYHGERCIGRWNVDAALLGDNDIGHVTCDNVAPTEALREDRLWQSTRHISG
jgi:broad specificity phosphatase PhoE